MTSSSPQEAREYKSATHAAQEDIKRAGIYEPRRAGARERALERQLAGEATYVPLTPVFTRQFDALHAPPLALSAAVHDQNIFESEGTGSCSCVRV